MRGQLRADLERRGFRLRDPVGDFALLRLIQAAPIPLPAGYLDLLRASNGGSGLWRGQRGFYLTPAEQVLSEHGGWGVDEHAPELLLFASDGEGGFFLLDEDGRVRLCQSSELGSPGSWQAVCERFEDLIAELQGHDER